jgi:sugar lactone lactonase YvrE
VQGIQETGVKIFVSDAVNNVVNIYNPKGKLLATLTGFSEPQGLATDAKGNLYVADTANSRIQIYASPYTKTPKSLADAGQYPAGVAVFNNGAVVAVTNIISTSDGAGSVTIYKKGKQGPTISNASFAKVYFDGFDAKGNLYIDGSNSDGGVEVGEIAKATTTGKKIAVLTTKNSIAFPGGVAVTTAGKIAIDDQDAAAVYTYNAPVKGSLGNPTKTTDLTGSTDAVTFAFNSNDKDLWTADAGNANSAEYAYPKGGAAVTTISVTGGEPIGVAITPAQP